MIFVHIFNLIAFNVSSQENVLLFRNFETHFKMYHSFILNIKYQIGIIHLKFFYPKKLDGDVENVSGFITTRMPYANNEREHSTLCYVPSNHRQ